MELRVLGKTGLRLSALGFGCGNVGGLMIRGTAAEQERAVARALDLGINYFDTAPSYGDGESETSLGRVWKALRPPALVGTKFRIAPGERGAVGAAVVASLEASLRRLQMERVDLFQLHNLIDPDGGGSRLTARLVLEEVVPALQKLQQQGKVGCYGISGLGDTAALHAVVGSGRLHTAQVCYNLLNPTAGHVVPPGFPAQDFGRLLRRAQDHGVGAIVIRVLAAGALSGVEARHAIAAPAVDPIASGPDYRADVRRATELAVLVQEGHASSLVEAALRFAVSTDLVTTVLVGYSSLAHLEYAAACVNLGPLARAAHDRLAGLWRGFAGEARPS